MCCVVVRACVRVRVCAYTWVYVCAFVIARELSCYRVHAMCVRERAGVRACMRVTYACECVYNRAWVGECTHTCVCTFLRTWACCLFSHAFERLHRDV